MSASFILLERTSRWAAAFRREMRKDWMAKGRGSLAAGIIPILEVRSWQQCERQLGEAPYSIVAVEVLPQNLVSLVKAASDWTCRFPHARFLAFVARGLEPHELVLRESGAIHVVYTPRLLFPLLKLIRRHLARVPKAGRTLEQAIWSGLPWG